MAPSQSGQRAPWPSCWVSMCCSRGGKHQTTPQAHVVVQGREVSRNPETSGWRSAARDPALLWSHNDSGNAAVLFALDSAGAVRPPSGPSRHARLGRRVRRALCVGRLPPSRTSATIGGRQRIQIYRVPTRRRSVTARRNLQRQLRRWPAQCTEAMFVIGEDLLS